MRHLKSYRKLGRESSHRKSMLRNMATSFVTNGRVCTTVSRAKELRPLVERLITRGKNATLADRRKAARVLCTDESLQCLFSEVAPRFKERPGGYTRIIKHGPRSGDNAAMCALELVDYAENEGEVHKKKKTERLKKKAEKLKEEEEKNRAMPTA